MTDFIAPCTKYYGCSGSELYARDSKVDFIRCDCGLIWKDTNFVEKRVYDKDYFKRYEKRKQHKINKAHMLFGILEQHTIPGRLLEIGPGLGYNMIAARERGWEVQGVDISDYVVDHSKSIGLPVMKGSLEDVQGEFDAVFMKHVLEHYKDPFAALYSVRELLSNDGLIQIIVPDARYRKAVKFREKYKFYSSEVNGKEHYVSFNKDTLGKMLDFTGFEVVQVGLPTFVKYRNSVGMIVSRFVRERMSKMHMNQEMFVVARKK